MWYAVRDEAERFVFFADTREYANGIARRAWKDYGHEWRVHALPSCFEPKDNDTGWIKREDGGYIFVKRTKGEQDG